MPHGVVGGLLTLALIIVCINVGLWCILNAPKLWALALRLGRAVHLLPPLPPVPLGMPIERIASDLRRIRPEASQPMNGMPMARRRGIIAAYDQALVDACRALGVATELDVIIEPLERESERLRTEVELERAGVDLG
jgi:hypothetical protein